ncbi:GNAT family N-acetyltransferase [Enterococcus sp. HY326]|uniref:GNAT family N-acetyltransferase n=1 Tax=Enterococcus sp. HY326 TaxID=2971265 RepID=UPI00223F1CFC|nr:GNAT family N-acetyltransferase [Enterococcus sp. HY326]
MEIETGRLLLREHALEDYERFWQMMIDPIAKKYTGGITTLSYEERKKKFQNDLETGNDSDELELAVIEKNSGKYLGYCGVRRMKNSDNYEFLYGYCQDSWGHGYATEAGKAFLDYMFKHFNQISYFATSDLNNTASVKVLKKLGFKRKKKQEELDYIVDLYILEKDEAN